MKGINQDYQDTAWADNIRGNLLLINFQTNALVTAQASCLTILEEGNSVTERSPMAIKRDEALARRLSVQRYTIPAIDLGITKLAESLGDPCVLAVQALISRAVYEPTPEERQKKKLESGYEELSDKAIEALSVIRDHPLFMACLLMEASYSADSRERVRKLLIEGLKLELTPEAREIWNRIEDGKRPTIQEIAAAVGLKKWRNHPRQNEPDLFDHCRRVHANPTPLTVSSMACDYIKNLNIVDYPLTRKTIVNAVLWSEHSWAWSVAIRPIRDYLDDILDIITQPIFGNDRSSYYKSQPDGAKPHIEGVKSLVSRLFEWERNRDVTREERAKIVRRILSARCCPWLWDRWNCVCKDWPIIDFPEETAAWFVAWQNETSGYAHGRLYGEKEIYHKAIKESGRPPFDSILNTVPPLVQAHLASLYRRVEEWLYMGFDTYFGRSPSVFMSVLLPFIEKGDAGPAVVASAMRTMRDADAAELLEVWSKPAETDWLYNRSRFMDPENELLVAQINRLDIGIPEGILRRREILFDLIANGYILRPDEVDILLNPKIDFTDRGECYYLRLWSTPNAEILLRHPWDDSQLVVVIGSAIVSSVHCHEDGHTAEEWLETILVPVLEEDERARRIFCRIAWSDQTDLDHARDILLKDDRLEVWMADESELIKQFISKPSIEVLRREPDLLKRILTEEELRQYILKVNERGMSCSLGKWVYLFTSDKEKIRLAAFLGKHLSGSDLHFTLEWIKSAGLVTCPSIRRKLESLLDSSNEQIVTQVAEILQT